MTEVFTTGTVSGKQYVGGITGYLSDNSTITNAYATGNIYSNFEGSGIAYVQTGAVSNVYVTGNRGVFNPNIFMDSINAIVNTGLQANGYWNTNSSGAVNSTLGTGLSLSQFYQASSFSGFDFSESGPWAIIEGKSFPYLKAIPLDFPPGYIFDFDVVSEFSSNIEILNDGETASIQLTVRNDGFDDLMSDAEVVFSKQNLSDLSFSSGTVTDSTWTIGPLSSGQSASITVTVQKTDSEVGFLSALVSYLDQNDTVVTQDYTVKIAPPPYGMASAMQFNGSNQYASTNISAEDAGFTNSSFAVDVWVKPDNLNGTSVILGQLSGDSGERLQIGLHDGNAFMSFSGDVLTGNTALASNIWYHLAFVYDADTMEQKIFLNGIEDGSRTAANHFSGTSELYIGRGSDGYFSGQMDELRLWTTTSSWLLHQTINPDSDVFHDLSSYYRFDANQGDILFNFKGVNATLYGSPDWVSFSGVPAGNVSAFATVGNDANVGSVGDELVVSGLTTNAIHLYKKGEGSKPLRSINAPGEQFSTVNGFQTIVNNRLNTTFGLVPRGDIEITGQLDLSYGTAVGENLLNDPLYVIFRPHPDSSWVPDLNWNNDTSARVFTRSGVIHRGEYSVASFRVIEPIITHSFLSMDDPNPNDIRVEIQLTNQGPDVAQNMALLFEWDENITLPGFGSEIPEFDSTTNILSIGNIDANDSKSFVFSFNYENSLPFSVSAVIQQTGNLLISDPGNLTENFIISAPPYGGGSALNLGGALATNTGGSALGLVNSSFTVEAWVKPSSVSGDRTILGQNISGNPDSRTIHLILRNGRVHMGFYGDDLTGQTDVPAGLWSHVAFTYDVNTNARTVYLNGVADGTDFATGPFMGEGNVYIGQWNNENFLNGRIDELRIWNTARSPEEIRQTMHRTISVLEADFQNLNAYYRFDEGTGTTAYDLRNGFNASLFGSGEWEPSQPGIGQQSAFVASGQTGSSGNSGSAISIENLTGSDVTLYAFGGLNRALRTADTPGENFSDPQLQELGITARSAQVWGLSAPDSAAASLRIDYSSLAADSPLIDSPGIIFREGPGQAWSLLPDSLWTINFNERDISFSGPLPSGEFSLAAMPFMSSPYSGSTPGWRMIGAPGAFARYNNVLADIWTQGFPGASEGENGDPNVFFYDEAQRSWVPPAASTNLLGTGNDTGFRSTGRSAIVYFFEDQYPFNVRYSGIMNAQETQVQLPATVLSEDDGFQGWHLVSNPFPFPIDWTRVVADGLSEVAPPIFLFDANTFDGAGGFRVHYGFNIPGLPGQIQHDGIIPPFQGFFIRTAQIDGTPGLLTFRPAHQAENGGGQLFRQGTDDETEPPLHLLLSVENAEGTQARSSLLKIEKAAEDDAGDAANGFVLAEIGLPASLVWDQLTFGLQGSGTHHSPLSMKHLHLQTGHSYSFPVLFDAQQAGTYTLRIPTLETWQHGQVRLNDHHTGETVVMEAGSSYVFQHSPAQSRPAAEGGRNLAATADGFETTRTPAGRNASATATAESSRALNAPIGFRNSGFERSGSAAQNSADAGSAAAQPMSGGRPAGPAPRFSLQLLFSKPEQMQPELPSQLALDQNYPNPFNPTTTIQYALPESGQIRLDVFNVLGQRVATLINGEQTAGFHSLQFDGSRLSSGVYLYRLQSGNQVITRKMLLVK
ncbi:MAG: T9SS type A sorting domain-containing protein [Balneolales bacterium]|nr:T9SS type A sorting domain-containing protein [Balneolales bacterium]